jgi:hypothetical protein
MLAFTRESLLGHLRRTPEITDLAARRDPAFPDRVAAWLGQAEESLQRLRSPLLSLVVGQRASLVAVSDGLRDPRISPSASTREARRATAALCLIRVEEALRQAVATVDGKLDEAREKMLQLLAVASAANPLPLTPPDASEEALRRLWMSLGEIDTTRTLHTYLNAALTMSDRLYLLREILENLLAGNEGGSDATGGTRVPSGAGDDG